MNIFGNPYNRGCFIHQKVDTSSGRGAKLVGTGRDIPDSTKDPFIIQGFAIRKAESVALIRCFNEQSFIYAFGDNLDQSVLSVKAVGLLPAEGPYTMVSNMLSFYASNRIYASDKPVRLVYGGSTAISGYVMGISSSTINTEASLHDFTIDMLLVLDSTQGVRTSATGMTGSLTGGRSTGMTGSLTGGRSTRMVGSLTG